MTTKRESIEDERYVSPKAAEKKFKVALVGKAGLQRRLHGRDPLLQQLSGLADADVFQVAVRCNAL